MNVSTSYQRTSSKRRVCEQNLTVENNGAKFCGRNSPSAASQDGASEVSRPGHHLHLQYLLHPHLPSTERRSGEIGVIDWTPLCFE